MWVDFRVIQEELWLLVCFSWASALNSGLWSKVFHSKGVKHFLFVILVINKQCHAIQGTKMIRKVLKMPQHLLLHESLSFGRRRETKPAVSDRGGAIVFAQLYFCKSQFAILFLAFLSVRDSWWAGDTKYFALVEIDIVKYGLELYS